MHTMRRPVGVAAVTLLAAICVTVATAPTAAAAPQAVRECRQAVHQLAQPGLRGQAGKQCKLTTPPNAPPATYVPAPETVTPSPITPPNDPAATAA